ncbi:MAG: hypothetical protein ACRDHX_05555 [Chloroflexota bacterium]
MRTAGAIPAPAWYSERAAESDQLAASGAERRAVAAGEWVALVEHRDCGGATPGARRSGG